MTEPSSDLWTPGGPGTGSPFGAARHGAATRTFPAVTVDGIPLTGASRAPGRVPPAARRRRWPWMVLVLVGVAALLLGLVRCGADRARTDAPAEPSWSTATPAGTPPPPGSLSAGVTSVFAAAAAGGTGLAALTGQTATGHAVPVQSVPADEGFWIGAGPADRVWVQLTTNGESAVTITPGQLLDLAGPVVPHGSDFAGKAGVTGAEGAEQLTRQAAHLEVDPNRITAVGTR